MNAIKNITVGHTERLRKPVGYTMLANLVNIVPFCLSIEAINVIFRTFDGSGTPLDTNRLWMIFAILVVYGGDGFCRTRRLSCKLSRCL